MGKKKSSNFLAIFLIVLFIIGLGIGGYFVIKNNVLNAIVLTPSAGCNSVGTTSIKASTYTCNSDECIVSGTMTVDKPMSIQELWWKCSNPSKGVSGEYKTFEECRTGCQCSATSPCLTCQQTVVKGITSYKASFNFCPSTDLNFKYCAGSSNSVTAGEVITYYTDEVKLKKGQSVQFIPKNTDGSLVTNYQINVRLFDCSCISAVQGLTDDGVYDSEDACDVNSQKIYCKPSSNEVLSCPSGYSLVTFATTSCEKGVANPTINGQTCRAKISGWRNCVKPTSTASTTYNTYQKCDSTKQIDGSTCGAFSTTLLTCGGNMKCYTDKNQLAEGLGSCRCSQTDCAKGNTRGTVGATTYELCETVNTCNDWVAKSCPSG